ncbi:hypothetical protein A4D02_34875 [Niastella koreensis]|uniref:UspA domain-containing protein n=2 Tax=Niastella koreensis TaxID=354356 RepID=G8TJB5_NIAKG|nr:universal stress protein [Niastella koreensis]AEV98648.1 UspA domain-containing protein [Niastella koreensis GR20-10]OQP44410.1 hypothetical protein A4D02_34875 [Niastella koreensis]
MKTILVATDFSDASHNAFLYAAQLAKSFNAGIILFNAYEPAPVPVSEIPIPILTYEEMETRTQQLMENEKQLPGIDNQIAVETFYKPGKVTANILQAVKEKKADLIITGMKRTTAVSRLFGSTVTALAKKLPVPMLVIPEETPFKELSAIALAVETDAAPDSDPHLLDVLREMGERFHAKLYLVKAVNNRFQESYEVLNRPVKINKMVRTMDPAFEFVEGKDIPQALNGFISSYNVNLLALLPHQHALWSRWFYNSITRAMIFESHIPLLIIPEQHKNSISVDHDQHY